jgi:hypothetical protein
MTVIGGADDFMVSRASTDATASAYGVKPIYMEGCAHMVRLESDPVVLSRLMMAPSRQGQQQMPNYLLSSDIEPFSGWAS